MYKYEIILYWSNDDAAFVAEVPELPGCMAHGRTQEAALGEVNEAMRLWIETARESGDPGAGTEGRTPDARLSRTGDGFGEASSCGSGGARRGRLVRVYITGRRRRTG